MDCLWWEAAMAGEPMIKGEIGTGTGLVGLLLDGLRDLELLRRYDVHS